MAKQRSPDVLTEEQREEIAARREAELWGMAQRIGGPQALRELLPKLDERAMSVHSVGFGDLAKEIGVVAAVAKLGFETQFIEAAKRNGILGASVRLGYGPGDRAVYRGKSNSWVLRPLVGGGADTSLLDRAIRASERAHLNLMSKALRLQRILIINIEKRGSISNQVRAKDLALEAVEMYKASKLPPHNRAAQIATKLNLSPQRVRQILVFAGIKKRKSPKRPNSQVSA